MAGRQRKPIIGPAMPSPDNKNKRIARLQAELDAAIAESNRGKPAKYQPSFAARVTDMCLLGLNNREIAERFGVTPAKITHWIDTIPEFRQAVWEGREGADQVVAAAMFKAAKGYEHPEDDIRTVSLGGNRGSEIVITPTVKRYPPNDRAAQAWLRNRQRERWPALFAEGNVGDGMNAEERAAAVRAAVKAALAEVDQPSAQESQDGNEDAAT